MKAIILPLNDIFYNWELHSGKSAILRFWERHPFLEKIAFLNVVKYPIVLLYTLPFLGSIIIRYFVERWRRGEEYATNKIDARIAHYLAKQGQYSLFKKANQLGALESIKYFNYRLLIYYTEDKIPMEKKSELKFKKRLDEMQRALNLEKVFLVKSKEDIEEVIATSGIDVSSSFFISDGTIMLDRLKALTELSVLPEEEVN